MALDRWTRLQAAPFGTSSSLRDDGRGGSAGRNLRRLNEDYGMATRLLRRQARRGDARSALNLIKVREDAIAQGIDTSNIRSREEYDAGIRDRVSSMQEGALDRERATAANRKIADEALADESQPPPANPNATPARSPEPQDTRTSAALDIYEGQIADNEATRQRGLDAAKRLGVQNPVNILSRGNVGLAARQLLDRKLGQTRSPGDVSELRDRAARLGVRPEDFDRRASWWERNRRI